jgi:nitrate reductase NapE component
MVLSTTTVRGQRAGEVFAAAIGAAAWIGFIFAALGKWPQLCVVQSIVVVGIIGWLVRMNWKVEEGPSPEGMLSRLMEVKRDCREKGSRE